MDNQELIKLMYCLAEQGSRRARRLDPGPVISERGFGDYKRKIDQVAEKDVINTFRSKEADFEIALSGEDSEWGEKWIKPSGETITANKLKEDVDYALIIDQVEGTKNLQNTERYTTLAVLDPENPALEDVEASLIYRWDGALFFSDGKNAYQNTKTGNQSKKDAIRDSSELKAEKLNEVNYLTKIRSQAIGKNIQYLAEVMNNLIEHYELSESNWPSLKADGTTTGDILGTVNDKSIAIDVRALKNRERLPFAQDFVPAAKIAQDAGVKIIDEHGEKIETDFTEAGSATNYIALPPGKASEEIEEILPKILGL